MSEQMQPSLAAWADLASVRRTIEWVGLDEERLTSANYTGAGILRLLNRINQQEGLDPAVREVVDGLKAEWAGFDAANLAHRSAVVDASRTLLDSVVTLGELGARRKDHRKVRLSKPSRRDRPKRTEAAKAIVAEAITDQEAALQQEITAEVVEVSLTANGGSESAEKAPISAVEAEAVSKNLEDEGPDSAAGNTATDEPFSWLNLPARSPRATPRAPRRLDWGHPEGSGAPIGHLGVLNETDVGILSERNVVTIGDFLVRPPVGHSRVRPAKFGATSGDTDQDHQEVDLGSEESPVMVRGRLTWFRVLLSPQGRRYEMNLDVRGVGGMRLVWLSARPRGWANWRVGMELAFIGVPTEDDEQWKLL